MKKNLFSLIILTTTLFSCVSVKVSDASQDTKTKIETGINTPDEILPKNIILLIGDGTGLSEVSASLFYNKTTSNYLRFPQVSLIKTSSASDLITDSAAGATAFASGVKTNNGVLGLDSKLQKVSTLVEIISPLGYATGVVSTSSVVHATPAAFYTHVSSRRNYEEIAETLVNSEIDFFAGGGLDFFTKRKDGKNLLNSLKEKGFTINTTALPMQSKKVFNYKQGYLLAPDGMPKMLDGRGDFLPNATKLAIESLSQMSDKGFFLMVEGSQIDWGGHNNDADYLISELIDFDHAIGVALDYAEADGNTLVIVLADHETGGFTLASDNGSYNKIKPTFSTTGHSATMVPVFAKGPGEELFTGTYENTDVFLKFLKLLIK
jgi:alkaline phosphatase